MMACVELASRRPATLDPPHRHWAKRRICPSQCTLPISRQQRKATGRSGLRYSQIATYGKETTHALMTTAGEVSTFSRDYAQSLFLAS